MAQKGKMRFWHTADLDADISTWRQVYPLGAKTYQYKKDKKELFYRHDKKGGYIFSNYDDYGVEVNDFNFFNAINKDQLLRCVKRYIVTEVLCKGEYVVKHIGKFTMNNGKFDLDKCTIEIKQNVVDAYSCLKENRKKDFNILNVAPVITALSPRQNNFDFSACRNKEWLSSLNRPCDATGGWKKIFTKAATNTPQPHATTYNDVAADDYYSCLITENHAAWIKKVTGAPDIYSLEVYTFINNTISVINVLDAQSSVINDGETFGFTQHGNSVFKIFTPDTGIVHHIATISVATPIIWYDYDIELGYAFYYDGVTLKAYDFSTNFTRTVAAVNISTGAGELNISYGDGLLAYHDGDNDILKRYNPQTFIIDTVQTVIDCKFLHSESSFLTWFNIDDEKMYLQNRDDLTFEVIELRDNGGDCRWFYREKEWLVMDDKIPVGVQIAINLINIDIFSLFDAGFADPTSLDVKIENGWYLFHSNVLFGGGMRVHYLDSRMPGVIGSEYNFAPNLSISKASKIHMSAGVERIYISGLNTTGAAPHDWELYSIDMDTQVATLIENLGDINGLNCIFMNNFEQAITTNKDRITIYKENIQRDDELAVWFRERIQTVSIGGVPTSPGVVWFLYRDQTNQFGTATWVKQPSLVVNPADIEEGECLCTDDEIDLVVDEDECVSLEPFIGVDFTMLPNTSLTAGVIKGIPDGQLDPGNNPFTTIFYIEKPRDNSVYTWVVPATATIITGQGTPIIEVEFTALIAPASQDITCQEVNPCEAAPIPIITHPVKIYNSTTPYTSPVITIPMDAPVDANSGDIIRFVREYTHGWHINDIVQVTHGTILNDYTDNKGRRVIDVSHNGVNNFCKLRILSSYQVESVLTIPIVPVTTFGVVVSPNEVCPTGNQTYFIKAPKVGCDYIWSVDAPSLIVGSNVGESVVIDMNGGAGDLHFREQCTVVEINRQLIAPCNVLHSDSWWWKIGVDIEYKRCRLLKNVIEEMVADLCPDITMVRSDFFQWNPINPSQINYVYGGINEYNYMVIAQKSDIRNPNATEGATIGNLKWQDFAEWLANIEVYYLIIDGVMHIEHISRLIGTVGLDLTQPPFDKYADNQNSFNYAKEEMNRTEEYEWAEALNADFVGFPIEYKDSTGEFSLCVNEETEKHEFKDLTTDLKYIQTNPGDIENKGFVLLATKFNGTEYTVIQNKGLITQANILNSPMSMGVLQDRFMRYNRVLLFGHLNRQYTIFNTSKFFKKQDKFKIPFCCETDFNPIDLIHTKLGDGEIDTVDIDYKDDTMDIKLKYE